MELTHNPERILIIKPSSLGDVCHALPVLNLLRRRFPAAHISWLVAPACAGLIQNHASLNEVLLFDRRALGSAWRSASAMQQLRQLKRELRERRFDLVIDLQGLFRSGWLSWLTRSPMRVGFANAREMAWMFYTHRVGIQTMEQHAMDRYLAVAAALGCETGPIEYHFPVSAADRDHVAALVGDDPCAVLLPGANWPTKRWPAERFAALVAPLRERLGLRSVIAGGADATELSRHIPEAQSVAGQTTVPQLVALLERASLVIANDSGPMHIAAALNRPLVAIFGPTNPVRTGPYGRMDSVVRVEIECAPCYARRCSHLSCLNFLGIEPVLAAAQRQMMRTTRLSQMI